MKNNFWRTSDRLSFTLYPHFAKEQTNKGGGRLSSSMNFMQENNMLGKLVELRSD